MLLQANVIHLPCTASINGFLNFEGRTEPAELTLGLGVLHRPLESSVGTLAVHFRNANHNLSDQRKPLRKPLRFPTTNDENDHRPRPRRTPMPSVPESPYDGGQCDSWNLAGSLTREQGTRPEEAFWDAPMRTRGESSAGLGAPISHPHPYRSAGGTQAGPKSLALD